MNGIDRRGEGGLLRTTDGGATWTTQPIAERKPLNGVQMQQMRAAGTVNGEREPSFERQTVALNWMDRSDGTMITLNGFSDNR